MPGYHMSKKTSNTRIHLPVLTHLDLQEAVKGRFASFCTAVGIQTLMSMMDQDVETLAGPKGKHDQNRTAYRHGFQETSIPMGPQRLSIKRPRVRSNSDRNELPIASYEVFNNDETLIESALGRMLHGISTRDYTRGIEDYSDVAHTFATSKSTVSRRFVQASEEVAKKLLSKRFDEEHIVALLIDGVVLGDYTAIVTVGINKDGRKLLIGVRIGTTENSQVCEDLLTDLINRGLNFAEGLLAVIDGSKALRKALKKVFGDYVIIQRCQVHKMRNVLDYLPRYKRAWTKKKLRQAWSCETFEEARRKLNLLAEDLRIDYPDAANSLYEGLEETITVLKLEIPGLLRKSLSSTNPIESGFSMVGKHIRNVKNWVNGSMVQRWVIAAMLEAEQRFHRISGYRSISVLIKEIKRLTVGSKIDARENERKTYGMKFGSI